MTSQGVSESRTLMPNLLPPGGEEDTRSRRTKSSLANSGTSEAPLRAVPSASKPPSTPVSLVFAPFSARFGSFFPWCRPAQDERTPPRSASNLAESTRTVSHLAESVGRSHSNLASREERQRS